MKALNWKKRMLASLLALVMVVTLLPVSVIVPAKAASGTGYTVWTQLASAMQSNSSGYFNCNFVTYASKTITVPKGVTYTLDLNGHRVEDRCSSSVFDVYGTLNIINTSSSTASINHYVDFQNGNCALIYVNGGTLNIGGSNSKGAIYLQNNQAQYGGAVDIVSSGTFNMYANTYINNCKSTVDGGGVSARSGGKFYM